MTARIALPYKWRRGALLLHIAASVGWLGAVFVYIGLAVVGLTSADEPTVRGAYLVMEPLAWAVLLPLALASLVTGVVSSVTSTWGLIGHYWVVFKLVINVFATVVLVMYTQTFGALAELAANPAIDLAVVRNPSPMLHGSAAAVVLVAALVLSVYKPRGITRFGSSPAK